MIELLKLFENGNKIDGENAFLDEVLHCKSFRYKVIDLVPLSEILMIYEKRSEINIMKGSKTKGYDKLLKNLKNSKTDNVKIQIVLASEYQYRIFTDVEVTTLLGILKIPGKK